MSELLDEIKESFEKVRHKHADGNDVVQVTPSVEETMPPAFMAMQTYYKKTILSLTRRGFRHFAGASMPTASDELLDRTREVMYPALLAMLLQIFADGVRIGQRDDQMVKMAFHFDAIDSIYDNDSFVHGSNTMAFGFAEDDEIRGFFRDYLMTGTDHMSHICGFAHSEVDPNQVWDLWMLVAAATIGSCFMAGHEMGSSWRERDVLDGIEIASEGDHGSD